MNPDDADDASKNDPADFVRTPENERPNGPTDIVDPEEDAIAADWVPPLPPRLTPLRTRL